MSREIRTRVIYDYGRWDFEQELKGLPLPTDEEWASIQQGMQLALNVAGDDAVRDLLSEYRSTKLKENN